MTICVCSEIKIHPTHVDWVLARVRRNECLQASARPSYLATHDLRSCQVCSCG